MPKLEDASVYVERAKAEYAKLHQRMCEEAAVTCCVSVVDDEQCNLLGRIFGKELVSGGVWHD